MGIPGSSIDIQPSRTWSADWRLLFRFRNGSTEMGLRITGIGYLGKVVVIAIRGVIADVLQEREVFTKICIKHQPEGVHGS